jgi:SAM-dependent methyltransferase
MKKLNFGCGNNIKKGWTNVDCQKAKGIDFSFDFIKDKYPFKESEFDYVLIDNVLEHLSNPQNVMKKIWKICKKDAIVEIIVPYYNSYWAHSDPTHVNYFNEDSIDQTLRISPYDGENKKELFEIIELKSIPQRFLKWIPMLILNILKRFLGNIIVELRIKAKIINK